MKIYNSTLSWDMALKIGIIEDIYKYRYTRGSCEHCKKEIVVDNYDTALQMTSTHSLYGMSLNRLRAYRAAIINISNSNKLRTEDSAWCHLCTHQCIEAIHPHNKQTNNNK